MKHLASIILLFGCLNFYAQDSTSLKTTKIVSMTIFGSIPSLYANNKYDIAFMRAGVKNEEFLSNPYTSGYTDTSFVIGKYRSLHYFPQLANYNIGIKVLIKNRSNNRFLSHVKIPVTIIFDHNESANYYLGKSDSKRIDTINASPNVYLDSVNYDFIHYKYSVQRLFIQSGFYYYFKPEKTFKWYTGLNVALGVSLKNELKITKEHVSEIKPLDHNQNTSQYYKLISNSDIKHTSIGYQSLSSRFSVPIGLNYNIKKYPYLGFNIEAQPGLEIQNFNRNTYSKFFIYLSFGICYNLK